MRTQKSLGYYCYSKLLIFEGILGLTYEIQTNNTAPAILSEHIEKFFKENIDEVFYNITDLEISGNFKNNFLFF